MPDDNQKPLQEQLSEIGTQIAHELKRAIQIVEEQVVPEVREKSSIALRDVSQRMEKLAKHLDSLNSKPPG